MSRDKTNTSFDGLHEAITDDHWNTDGAESLSEPWIGVTSLELLTKKPWEVHMLVELTAWFGHVLLEEW